MAIRNKITKPFPMWSKGSIIIAQFFKYKITISQNRRYFSMSSILKRLSILSGSRAPDGPDLPSPLGRKFQLSVTPCLMMGEVHYDSRHDKLKNSGYFVWKIDPVLRLAGKMKNIFWETFLNSFFL